ncbi:aconitate hydratase AcnA [Bifidobacterium asteroides]|uniref:Aconitate hydratase n=1 Tax=Bifidobacterium asteroides TaxID=1684 RepID=A0A318M5E6_9BIFI|nr:aconitate hydratase AcnA [Bifidobacterium asteroides]PXY82656.1 aconitate hydratase AcnA [Bifidobacterium asteroides]
MSESAQNTGRSKLKVGSEEFEYYRISDLPGIGHLPYSLRILAENLLRHQNGTTVTRDQLDRLLAWDPKAQPDREIQFTPARVLMQDFTGVPCMVDLATMRDAVKAMGDDPSLVNPLIPAQMVIDHSVQVDSSGAPGALEHNMDLEYQRNSERYRFLRWSQQAFRNFRVVPPGTGIIHQVNLEYLAQVVMRRDRTRGKNPALVYPDSCVGTDSHTTMVNGLGVLGWGVGGIEAEAAMLGQPISMLVPQVLGFKLTGSIPEGVTATDVVLTVTQMLREVGVVGQFVEFHGKGLAQVPLANRATLGNMSPEFGSTCAIFPIDQVTLDYLRLTGRSDDHVRLVEAYAKANGLWMDPDDADYLEPEYSQVLELDLSTVRPSIAGPRRPQDRILLDQAQKTYQRDLKDYSGQGRDSEPVPVRKADGSEFSLRDGDVVIAAITSCTNTSNPSVMVAAGLLARQARARGLRPKPWVKTSLAPGSQVVTDYLNRTGLSEDLDALGFELVGYGCTTCIGNSGPLDPAIHQAIADHDLTVTAVLSGNRNFEGRISPDVKMNYLASPPLVVAYALAGTMDFDPWHDPLGRDSQGSPVMLADIWPSQEAIESVVGTALDRDMYLHDYADVFGGDERWRKLDVPEGELFHWDQDSTYIRRQTFFDGMKAQPDPLEDIHGARVLALLGDSVTTDHISPAGAIKADAPAGRYLQEHGIAPRDFNSYGSRRGNHEVMVRGTFGNIRLRNQLLASVGLGVRPGGFTYDFLNGQETTIFEAAQDYAGQGTPLVVLAGSEYGTGSSRDWAAKGTRMLGVRAVIARSFERIHRSNLIGMGVLPLEFPAGQSAQSLGLDGQETYDLIGVDALNSSLPEQVQVRARRPDGSRVEFAAKVRIDTPGEAEYYRNGGILQYVLRGLLARADQAA